MSLSAVCTDSRKRVAEAAFLARLLRESELTLGVLCMGKARKRDEGGVQDALFPCGLTGSMQAPHHAPDLQMNQAPPSN